MGQLCTKQPKTEQSIAKKTMQKLNKEIDRLTYKKPPPRRDSSGKIIKINHVR